MKLTSIISSLPAELLEDQNAQLCLEDGVIPADLLYAHAAGVDLFCYHTLITFSVKHDQILTLHRTLGNLNDVVRLLNLGGSVGEVSELPTSINLNHYVSARQFGTKSQVCEAVKLGIPLEYYVRLITMVSHRKIRAVHKTGLPWAYYYHYLSAGRPFKIVHRAILLSYKGSIFARLSRHSKMIASKNELAVIQETPNNPRGLSEDVLLKQYLAMRTFGIPHQAYLLAYNRVSPSEFSDLVDLLYGGLPHKDACEHLGLEYLMSYPFSSMK